MEPRPRYRLYCVACLLVAASLMGAVPASGPARPSTLPASSATKPSTQPATAPSTQPVTRPVSGKPGPEPLLMMDELKKLFEQGKYPELLKQLPRVLVLKGKAADPYNRYELLMLKFETHMHLKAMQPALFTLAEAQDVTDDVKKVAYCKSVVLLIKRSKNFAYQPGALKKEKPPTIDIVERTSRQKALQAFLADEMAVIGPKVEKAMDGRSIAGIAEAVTALQGFDQLELAADGGEESKKMVSELRSRGLQLMAKTVLRLSTRTDEIAKNANELVRMRVTVPTINGLTEQIRYRKRGIEESDRRELIDTVKTADQIAPNARGLVQATGGKVKDVEDLITAVEELRRKADKALNTDYNRD